MFALRNTALQFSRTSTSRFFSTSTSRLAVKELTSFQDFKKEVLPNKKVSLVDFYATWCGPCKQMAPLLENFSENAYKDNVDFYKVDVDQQSDLSVEYGITAMPTFVIFKDGEVFYKVVGANPQGIKQVLDAALKE
ncbi:unnamed protein product [Ambrosiozyma monospora]|uniref:Unnamed protein product n=1 Tax=Ambrosiozyma monospora TaxID=43982 RepID=A0A9W6Z0W4_AMBMO|nr:unnamed protein product [Ambrosiozyma monospora]